MKKDLEAAELIATLERIHELAKADPRVLELAEEVTRLPMDPPTAPPPLPMTPPPLPPVEKSSIWKSDGMHFFLIYGGFILVTVLCPPLGAIIAGGYGLFLIIGLIASVMSGGSGSFNEPTGPGSNDAF